MFRDDFTSRLPAANFCFLISGFGILDKGDLPHAITACNYLNRAWSFETSVVTLRIFETVYVFVKCGNAAQLG